MKTRFIALFALAIACSISFKSQAQPRVSLEQQQQAEINKFIRTLRPARTLTNRGRKAVWLTLSDRASRIILPAGWRITSRGFYQKNGQGGSFSHYMRPVRGRGGLLLTILYAPGGTPFTDLVDAGKAQQLAYDMASGHYDNLLFEAYRRFGGTHPNEIKRQEANKLIRSTSWGGLGGMILSTRNGTPLSSRKDDLLGIRVRARYMVTVASDSKMYSVSDSTSGQTRTVRTILASFRPG